MYQERKIYRCVNRISSFLIFMMHLRVARNVFDAVSSYEGELSGQSIMAIIISAYILADFINGLIHLYMDNNDNYESLVGPFVAHFHMHHVRMNYSHSNAFVVFFLESGYKIWLFFYLVLVIVLQQQGTIGPYISVFLAAFGGLSSFAEVSHYWCHNGSHRPEIQMLQKLRLILPRHHHSKHHVQDNVNYAFLNGMTDPIINCIARWTCPGYKAHTDLHIN